MSQRGALFPARHARRRTIDPHRRAEQVERTRDRLHGQPVGFKFHHTADRGDLRIVRGFADRVEYLADRFLDDHPLGAAGIVVDDELRVLRTLVSGREALSASA
jgi:hypothetical protein